MSYTNQDERYYLTGDKRVPDGTYIALDEDTIMPVTASYGYQVAYTEFRTPRSSYTTTDPAEVNTLVRQATEHDGAIGVWTDEDGLVWVEQCYWIEHQFPAEELGRAWHQKAIWDWSAGEEVAL